MRLAIAALFLCLPAFGQAPYEFGKTAPDAPTFDFTSGQGRATEGWLRVNVLRTMASQWPNAAQATWYAQIADEYWGDITITANGRTFDGSAENAVTVYRTYQLNSTFSPLGVLFTGFAGGPTVTGTAPTPGSPYTGTLGGFAPGSFTATWKTPKITPRSIAPYQLYAATGGVRSTQNAGFWSPAIKGP